MSNPLNNQLVFGAGEYNGGRGRRGACGGRAAAAALAAILLLPWLLVPAGCAKDEKPPRGHTDHAREMDDAAFAAGANKAPSQDTLYALARILATQGRDAECEYVLTRILQAHPEYLPAYADLGELYLRGNRLEDATTILSDGLSRAPQDPVLLNNMGMCSFLEAEYERALEAFTAAAAAAPRDPAYRANRAAALGMLGRDKEARSVYQSVLDSPEDVAHNIAVLRAAREGKAPSAAAPVRGK
ncbi:MAG TPA: tetratricopeptide repeat protein [Tepidisphaeraceae bacterium]|nr:tetratricopeptide repeat protein [Tepidisphaeraceae bacterium]